MKTKASSSKAPLLLLTLAGTLLAQEEGNQSEEIPIGSIKSLQTKVVEGTNSDIKWDIAYPVYKFNATDTEVTVKFITCEIGLRDRISFGTRINGAPYVEFYEGVGEIHPDYNLTPGSIVAQTELTHDTSIEFLVRHSKSRITTNGGWVSSANPEQQDLIISLVHGDPVPDVAPVEGQRSVAHILAPYTENGTINLAHNQKILLFEVFTDNPRNRTFDLQDLVLLVNFNQRTIKK